MDHLKIRNIIDDEDGIFCPVLSFSDFDGFSCGEDDLDEFICQDAEEHKKQLIAVTYSYCLKKKNKISKPIAFVSLSNDSIKFSSDFRSTLFPDSVNYKASPAVKIGRLGVDRKYQRMRFGSYLIETIKYFFVTDNRAGCRFLTVDAYNEDTKIKFYRNNEFFSPQKSQPTDFTVSGHLVYFLLNINCRDLASKIQRL